MEMLVALTCWWPSCDEENSRGVDLNYRKHCSKERTWYHNGQCIVNKRFITKKRISKECVPSVKLSGEGTMLPRVGSRQDKDMCKTDVYLCSSGGMIYVFLEHNPIGKAPPGTWQGSSARSGLDQIPKDNWNKFSSFSCIRYLLCSRHCTNNTSR